MAASFLHGVETIEIDDGAKPIKAVKSAVIGLVGTALSEKGYEEPKLVLSAKDIAQFGPEAGGTIVPALNAIFDQGGAQVFVVNKQGTAVASEAIKGSFTIKSVISGVYLKDTESEDLEINNSVVTLTNVKKDEKYVIKYADSIKNITIDSDAASKDITIDNSTDGDKVTVYKMPTYTINDDGNSVIEDVEINDVYVINDGEEETEITISSINLGTKPLSLDTENGGLFRICDTTDFDKLSSSMTITDEGCLSAGDTVLVEAGDKEELVIVGADKKIVSTLSGVSRVLLQLVEGTDFTIKRSKEDGDSLVKDPNGRYEGKVTAKYIQATTELKSTEIDDQKIIGNAFGEFETLYNQYGFLPKILIAPGYSQEDIVAAKMVAAASKIRAIALLDIDSDSDVGLIRSEAFNTSSDRVMFAYPQLMVGEEKVAYSQYLAGVMAAKDVEKGYWWSPSNTEIKGITGVSKNLTAMINDPNSEVNVLNEAAITTVFNSFGTGLRVWGNRNASFPAASGAQTFINVRRVADIIHESIEYAMLQFIDRPINNALIDAISESVNSFMRTLVSRGAILDGKCWFDPAKNEATEISNGHLVFSYDFMPPTPAERISFESKINIEYLKALGA